MTTTELLSPRNVPVPYKTAGMNTRSHYQVGDITTVLNPWPEKGDIKIATPCPVTAEEQIKTARSLENTYSRQILKVSSSRGKEIKIFFFINVFKAIRFLWFPFQTTKIFLTREPKQHFEINIT